MAKRKKKKQLTPEERRKKKRASREADPYDSPIFVSIVIVLSIIMGIVFLFSNHDNASITRDEAFYYEGGFDGFYSDSKYTELTLKEHDETFDIFTHTCSGEFLDRMEKMTDGEQLKIAVNPNNGYVIEILSGDEEILNFESSQTDIYNYSKGYIWIGAIEILLAIGVAVYLFFHHRRKREKNERIRLFGDKESIFNKEYIRYARDDAKARILLEHNEGDLKVIYRRVGRVNELVVNGKVYAEYKALIEFEHKLRADVGGHLIEAGLDEDSQSYMEIDGTLVEYKSRVI